MMGASSDRDREDENDRKMIFQNTNREAISRITKLLCDIQGLAYRDNNGVSITIAP
ncbi:MAG: hypothetical protein BWY17_02755 [Deltaproteobacteria bacterium ADurb.Bin207]|jgi:hypothetical protein|nr:MAG: hypothetical protein BWY17_02755 [Deltaproteobacteria bacterium ADurb.Bin207]